MKRMQLLGYALIASTAVLGTLTAVVGYGMLESPAHAQNIPDMNVTQGEFTIVSTEGCGGRSNLYVLDNRSERLIAYDHSREIEVIGQLDVARVVQRTLSR